MLDIRALKMYLFVACGGALGSIARFWLGNLGATLTSAVFPWGIIWVNWIGCFVIGFFSEATRATGLLQVSPETRNFVIVGMCGGFTTFSSFSLGTLALLDAGQLVQPLANVLLSVIGCMIAVCLGVWLVRFTHLSEGESEWRE